jgi:alcohol dehydrogenase
VREVFERDGAERLRRLAGGVADRASQRVRPTRQRMRALRAAPGARLSWQEVPVPRLPGPDGAIVRPIAASTCDIDGMIVRGAGLFALPLHLGHECVAEVLSVGERVLSVGPGDRVILPFQISCGSCAACRAGRSGNCLGVPPVSMYGMGTLGGGWGGTFADQVAVPFADAMLVTLPAGVDPVAAASAADNICDAHRHIAPHLPALLEEDPDVEVLVLAALEERSLFTPSTPLYAGLIARAYGASNVTFVDARPAVRELAERLGLQALTPPKLRRHPPARLVVDVSASHLGRALACTAPDGVCTSSGTFHRSERIPGVSSYIRNVTLYIGRAHAREQMPQVLDLLASGRLDGRSVVTTVASFDDAPAAIREHVLSGAVKTVLTAQ